jgi:hypothetical protein
VTGNWTTVSLVRLTGRHWERVPEKRLFTRPCLLEAVLLSLIESPSPKKMAEANALRSVHFRLPPYPDTLAGLEQVRDRERET